MLEQQNALYPKTKKLYSSVLIFESHASFHSLQSGAIIAFVKFAGSVKIAIDTLLADIQQAVCKASRYAQLIALT
jgi:hypothetical protein